MSLGTENKRTGSFYTPTWCVDILLEMSGFSSLSPKDRLSCRVIDPSCGDGAILCRLLETSIKEMLSAGVPESRIKEWIKASVYGFELDAKEALKCSKNMSDTCRSLGIDVSPNDLVIIAGDALSLYKEHIGAFDFVIGNPPYVRIHNLDEKPDSRYITGMCDLYYAFYDIGQRLLRPDGRLCFISPSSWMTSKSGEAMRSDLERRGCIREVLDFAHLQVFDNATTYTAITVIGTDASQKIGLWEIASGNESATRTASRPSGTFWCEDKFYPCDISRIRDVLSERSNEKDDTGITVRNGYATLCDAAYLVEGSDDADGYMIDVIKASRGNTHKMIYPYDDNGSLVKEDDIESGAPTTYSRLLEYKDKLLARNKVDSTKWWGFGRSQGIADTYADKVTVQSIIRPGKPVLTVLAPKGTGVYGGLYVTGIPKDELDSALADDTFMQYVKALSKYKSGGYYTFSGKELQRYLIWWKQNRDI